MTKAKTDNSPAGTTTTEAPETERANIVGELRPPASTKPKELNARMAPASYKQGHISLRYSPKEPPISDNSTDNK